MAADRRPAAAGKKKAAASVIGERFCPHRSSRCTTSQDGAEALVSKGFFVADVTIRPAGRSASDLLIRAVVLIVVEGARATLHGRVGARLDTEVAVATTSFSDCSPITPRSYLLSRERVSRRSSLPTARPCADGLAGDAPFAYATEQAAGHYALAIRSVAASGAIRAAQALY